MAGLRMDQTPSNRPEADRSRGGNIAVAKTQTEISVEIALLTSV